jgi:hypothetical protein
VDVTRSLDELNDRVESLAWELSEVRDRLVSLEARLGAEGGVAGPPAASLPTASSGLAEDLDLPLVPVPPDAVGLAGRALLALGGGYLLRYGSHSGVLPPGLGMLAGLAYAAFWLYRCERAARRGARLSAGFHGFAAILIAFPLLVESTLRFRLLGTSTAAALVAITFGVVLAVAARTGVGALALGATLAGALSSLALQIATKDLLPFAWATLAIAAGSEALAARGRWLALRWPAGLAVNLAVAFTLWMAARGAGLPPGYAPISPRGAAVLGLCLATLYVASTSLRTLRLDRDISLFETLEVLLALWIGALGAVQALIRAGLGTEVVGVCVVVLGLACYLAAFGVVDRRAGQARNFYAYTTFGGLLTLAGTRFIGEGIATVAAWSTLAVLCAFLGQRFDRMTLRFHAIVFGLAAAGGSGLLRAAEDGLTANGRVPWHPLTPAGGLAFVGVGTCYLLLARRTARGVPLGRLLPELLGLILLGWAAGGLLARLLGGVLASAPGPETDAGLLAAARTATIAAIAIGLAWAGRHLSLRELSAVVYPVVVAGGVKLLAEDFRFGTPLTQFLALALYGGTLVLVPRVSRRGE